MNERKTTQQIADELNLSRRTVSSILNGKSVERQIGAVTTKRVEDYIKETGFVPLKYARQLRSNDVTVGILHSGNLYSHLLGTFNDICHHLVNSNLGIEIIITPHSHIKKGIEELLSRNISKLIWIQTEPADSEFHEGETVINLIKNVDTIIYNYRTDSGKWDKILKAEGINTVSVNRSKGFSILGKELKNSGHNCVALAWDDKSPRGIKYSIPFQKAGLNISYLGFAPAAYSLERRAEWFVEQFMVLNKKQSIDAACFVNDELAGHFMTKLNKCGYSIPQDVSVTGFNGIPLSGALHVPLTTLAVPTDRMINTVYSFLKDNKTPKNILFTPKLIKRESMADRNS